MSSEDRISSEQQLRLAVEKTRALVSEAAVTGFNWEDGDWADRLFANQSVLTEALNTPATVGQTTVRLIEPETWWRIAADNGPFYTSSPFQKERWEEQGLVVETVTVEARHDGFLHRLIENAFSWALQDCNYLNPKYMDRLIAETISGMKPEQAAEWNATAPEIAARRQSVE
jgi:hypothetical protein